MPKHKLTGTVISNKTPKTVVVMVETLKAHPKYKKRYRMHKNYKAHVESGEYVPGSKVVIEECRPISKDKKWRVIKNLTPHFKDGSEEPDGSSTEENSQALPALETEGF